MPDWITHTATGSILFKSISKRFKFALIMLSAVLPDIAKVISIPIINFSSMPPPVKEFGVWYLEPFHTPFMALFYSLFLAIIIEGNIKNNFLLIYGSCLFHFFLDSFQKHYGFYQLLLYPFSFKNYNLQLFHTSHMIFLIAPLVCLPVIVYVFLKARGELKITFRYKGLLIFLFVFIFAFPLLTKKLFYKNNFDYLDFLKNPSKWENKKVKFGVSRVLNIEKKENKWIITVEELGYKFKLIWKKELPFKIEKDSRISAVGIYKNGVVYIDKLWYEPIKRKKAFSLIGLFFILMVILKPYILRNYEKGNYSRDR